jgi:hypothetical protein
MEIQSKISIKNFFDSNMNKNRSKPENHDDIFLHSDISDLASL